MSDDYNFGVKVPCVFGLCHPTMIEVGKWANGMGLEMGEDIIAVPRHCSEEPHVMFFFEDMNYATMCKLTFGGL